MLRSIIALLFVFFIEAAYSQTMEFDLEVIVKTADSVPLENASVSLLHKIDSSLAKITLTNTKGIADFTHVLEDDYLVSITSVGMEKYISDEFDIRKTKSLAVTLRPIGKTMKNVTIEAHKPFIERKLDRLVLNVNSSILNAGSNALEILEKAPGIIIDQNDNLTMKGRGNVIILIDNKPSPLSGVDLASFLRSSSASTIEKIEIISNPSARFEASGNAGIINIIMKKDQRLGTNGNFSLSAGQGIYFRTNDGVNINHRKKKLNVFASYNFGYRKSLNDLTIDRSFYNTGGEKTGSLALFNHMLYPMHTHNLRLGMDFFPGKKTIIGILVNGLRNNINKSVENSSSEMDRIGSVKSRFSTNSQTPDNLNHYGINLNFKNNIDDKGQEITIDIDRAAFHKTSDPSFITTYLDPSNNTTTPPSLLNGNMIGALDIYSIKSDYTKPLTEKSKLEVGIKTSFVKADNNLAFYNATNNPPELDKNRSNNFVYEENINAAYVSVNREYEKIQFQIGLRTEQANIRGTQKVTSEQIDTSYIRFFPSTFITYKAHKNHELGISYSKRIQRPTYTQLNPFQSFIDLTSYNTGNPDLKPEFTHSLELTYTFKQRTTISLSYARTIDEIAWIIKPVATPAGIVSVETNDNLANSTYVNLSISSHISIATWWNSISNLYMYKNFRSGIIENTPAENGIVSYVLNNSQQITLPKNWGFETSLNYQSKQQAAYAFAKAQWSLNAGLQKGIMGGLGTLRLSVSDIFRTFYPRVTSSFVNYSQYFTALRDTRALNLTFSCRFGKNSVQAARRRTTGVEEEKSRAN